MMPDNALVLFEIDGVRARLFPFSAHMPLTILLIIAKEGGSCDLRVVYRQVRSAIAVTRKQIDTLERDGYITLHESEADRRCKGVALTERAADGLTRYEAAIQAALARWQRPLNGLVPRPETPER